MVIGIFMIPISFAPNDFILLAISLQAVDEVSFRSTIFLAYEQQQAKYRIQQKWIKNDISRDLGKLDNVIKYHLRFLCCIRLEPIKLYAGSLIK